MPQPTNATKANIIGLVNAAMFLVVAFGVSLTDAQQGAIGGFVNAALILWVGLTYKDSPKRVPEGMQVDPGPPPELEPEQ